MYGENTVNETERLLHTDIGQGLTENEAARRLNENGPNELKKGKKKSKAATFLEQLNDPLIAVLLVAAVISFLLKEISDAMIISVVVVVNAVVGIIQEGKAQKALESLQKMSSPKATVRRQGLRKEIPARELVKGDIVILEAGMQVPADLRLVKTWGLKTEESALTGESLAVQKDATFLADKSLSLGDRKNEVFMSTLVTNGRAEGIVGAAGMETEIGKIAAMIDEVPKEFTPLQKRLGDLGRLLSIVSVLLCVALFAVAVLQKRNIIEMFLTAISLAVAAVPEGLPAIVTIVLAMSVSRMVKVHTIVRKLPSVETLGSVNVVCSDKTGTLTQNKMTVTTCYAEGAIIDVDRSTNKLPLQLLESMVLCNDAVMSGRRFLGDPTETALLQMASKMGVQKEGLERRMPRIGEKAFDSERKMMTTVHQGERGPITYTKGAPERILGRCDRIIQRGAVKEFTDIQKKKVTRAIEEMSARGLRILAFAMKPDSRDVSEERLVFVGLAGMMDPARPEVKDAVMKFKSASVRTVMITGDHVDTAFAIAKELNIARNMSECMTGEKLDRLTADQLKRKLPEVSVFARVSPEHKMRIVEALKATGNIVAMTGDGVNDAPSLRIADIGISMGMTGTDVAKSASDMILTDDNFATIEKAIEEGRSIYENIKKTVLFLLSSNFGEILTMFAAVLLGMPSPLKATHILWVNLITDSLPALALGVDKNDKEALMKRPPRKAKEGLFAGGGVSCTLFYGVLISVISLAAFLKLPWDILSDQGAAITLTNVITVLGDGDVLMRAQTYAFTVLGMSELFHAFGMRDVKISIFSRKRGFNPVMAASFALGFALQFAVTEIPYLTGAFGTASLSLKEWIYLLVLAAFPLIAHEVFVLMGKFEAEPGKKVVYMEAGE